MVALAVVALAVVASEAALAGVASEAEALLEGGKATLSFSKHLISICSGMKKFIIPFLLLFLLACDTSDEPDCSLVLCAGNQPVYLEILLDDENAIANGTYSMENIKIEGDSLEGLQVRVLTDICCETPALIQLFSFDWESGEYVYTLSLGQYHSFDIEVVLERSSSNDPCCGNQLMVSNVTSTEVIIQDNDGYFTISLN